MSTQRLSLEELFRNEDSLCCPACGGYNLHQQNVEVFFRGEDSETCKYVRVGLYEKLLVDSEYNSSDDSYKTHGNPSSRRSGLRIGFSCECCTPENKVGDFYEVSKDHLFYMTITQHKGTTYMSWERSDTFGWISKMNEYEQSQR